MARSNPLEKVVITAGVVKDLLTGSGEPPYGDAPEDQAEIMLGVGYTQTYDMGCRER